MTFTLADADEFVRRQDLRNLEAALHAYAEHERRKKWLASEEYRELERQLEERGVQAAAQAKARTWRLRIGRGDWWAP